MNYQKFDANSIDLIERVSAEITKAAPPILRWGSAKIGNQMQLPIFGFFQKDETPNWRVEGELIRIKCAAAFVCRLKINPFIISTHAQYGVVVYFFNEMKKILKESETFQTAKNHYTTLVAYLSVAGNE